MFIYISIILLIILCLFCIFIVYLEIYPIYNIEYIDKEILNYANQITMNHNVKDFNHIPIKPSIFSPFIELFNANNNVPNKFIDINDNYFFVKNYLNNQNVQMEPAGTILPKVIFKLSNEIERCEYLVSDLVQIALLYCNTTIN
jgi:hypothetical protein